MAVLSVFNNILDPSRGNLSRRFTKATGFWIDAPTVNEELEIDVFLQVYFSRIDGEKVRNLPLGRLVEGNILINQTDTETLKAIPYEYVDSDLEMSLFFLSSEAVYLDVYVIGSDCTLCDIDNRISQLEAKVDNGFRTLNLKLAGMQTTLNQILTAVSVDVIVPGMTNDSALFLIS